MNRIAVDDDAANEGLLNPHGIRLLSSAIKEYFYRSHSLQSDGFWVFGDVLPLRHEVRC